MCGSRDAFWAASIAARFTNPMIEAIVETAELSNADAARYLTDVIIKRRDKVVAYWIEQTNPLDRFSVEHARPGAGVAIRFDNAAVRLGVERAPATYQVRWSTLDNQTGLQRAVGGDIALDRERLAIPEEAWGTIDTDGARYAVAAISTVHAAHPHWSRPVMVTVRERRDAIDVVGIERPEGSNSTR